jgi:hypothetical protein
MGQGRVSSVGMAATMVFDADQLPVGRMVLVSTMSMTVR